LHVVSDAGEPADAMQVPCRCFAALLTAPEASDPHTTARKLCLQPNGVPRIRRGATRVSARRERGRDERRSRTARVPKNAFQTLLAAGARRCAHTTHRARARPASRYLKFAPLRPWHSVCSARRACATFPRVGAILGHRGPSLAVNTLECRLAIELERRTQGCCCAGHLRRHAPAVHHPRARRRSTLEKRFS
jgi:hypothetical protein